MIIDYKFIVAYLPYLHGACRKKNNTFTRREIIFHHFPGDCGTILVWDNPSTSHLKRFRGKLAVSFSESNSASGSSFFSCHVGNLNGMKLQMRWAVIISPWLVGLYRYYNKAFFLGSLLTNQYFMVHVTIVDGFWSLLMSVMSVSRLEVSTRT